MRHKYDTRAVVLGRSPLGEANAYVTLLTPGLGLLRARAQGIRRPGAKLATALTTFSESSLMLVRGREGWRVTGAVLEESWFQKMKSKSVRDVAVRVSGLLLRLAPGEMHDPSLFSVLTSFFNALATLPEETHEGVEMLTALRMLSALGLDAGEIPGSLTEFAPGAIDAARASRADYIARINHGITVSGL